MHKYNDTFEVSRSFGGRRLKGKWGRMILGDGILSILAADIIIWPIDPPAILLLNDAGLKYAILN